MKKLIAVFLFAAIATFSTEVRAVTINWLPVGSPGNARDGATSYGGVGYSYNIDKYDVYDSQYVEFLNAKDPTGFNPLNLYNATMGGINFNGGAADGSKYSTAPGNLPVNSVSWYSAIRFANWLNNGQGNGDTETGAYTLLGGTPTPSNGSSIMRNAGATVFLPNENEWYKAAYYDPRTTAQGGPPADSHYWLYGTSSNTIPTASGPTDAPNSANYNNAGGGAPTGVGSYTNSSSPSGATDMAGNVFQWNESVVDAGSSMGVVGRGLRGGWFGGPFNTYSPGFWLASTDRMSDSDNLPYNDINRPYGFRVASISLVPEPSSIALATFGIVGLMAWGWRRRKR